MKKGMLVWILASVFVLSMASLTLGETPKAPAWMGTEVKEWVADAKAMVKKVSAADVKAAIDKKEKAVFLDIRDPDEWAAKGTLPGATLLSRGKLEFFIWGVVPDKDTKIYVYCKTGARASLATKTLNKLGYRNAVLMDAHFADWVKAGYPVVKR